MVVMMKELFATQYLYVTYVGDIQRVFEVCNRLKSNPSSDAFAGNAEQKRLFDAVRAGEEVVFDLANTNMTTDACVPVMSALQAGYLFQDSVDPGRDKILKENHQRYLNNQIPTVDMPPFDLKDNATDYVKSLSSDVLYKIPNNTASLLLVVLTAMVRPKVQFAMETANKELFRFVGSKLALSTLMQYDEYYYSTNQGIEVVQRVGDKIPTQQLGMATLSDAQRFGHLVPTAFGRERLFKEDGWSHIFNEALNILNKLKLGRSKTLGEVLKKGNNYVS